MISESSRLTIRENVLFTTMVGHKASVKRVKRLLEDEGEKVKFVSTEFCQGRTIRWGVAWSFNPAANLLDDEPSLLRKRQEERRVHKPVQFKIKAGAADDDDCKTTFMRVSEWLKEVDFSVKPGKLESSRTTFTAKTFSRGWQNQRRKRREKKRMEELEKAKLEEQQEQEPVQKRARWVKNKQVFCFSLSDIYL